MAFEALQEVFRFCLSVETLQETDWRKAWSCRPETEIPGGKRESTQSSIENLLKPYASSISLDSQNLPGRDTLVSEIFRMVEKLEDVLPISLSSVFAI